MLPPYDPDRHQAEVCFTTAAIEPAAAHYLLAARGTPYALSNFVHGMFEGGELAAGISFEDLRLDRSHREFGVTLKGDDPDNHPVLYFYERKARRQ